MSFRLISSMALVLLPATVHIANAKKTWKCAKAGENCLKKGCCSTIGTACYQKTDDYAACLPVDTCKKGVHEKPPYDQPWSCVMLTWGCNDAYNPCEGGQGQSADIIPCCQWGCVCNYTSKYYHQCVPPEGQNHCGKNGPQKRPKFDDDDEDDDKKVKKDENSDHTDDKEDKKKKADDDDTDSEKNDDLDVDDEPEEEEDATKDVTDAADAKDLGKNCFDMGNGKLVGPDCPESKVELSNGGTAVAVAVSRLPWLAAGALAMAILAASATMVARRRQRRGAGHQMLQVDPEPYELDAETS